VAGAELHLQPVIYQEVTYAIIFDLQSATVLSWSLCHRCEVGFDCNFARTRAMEHPKPAKECCRQSRDHLLGWGWRGRWCTHSMCALQIQESESRMRVV
jgi:hypothetical protein